MSHAHHRQRADSLRTRTTFCLTSRCLRSCWPRAWPGTGPTLEASGESARTLRSPGSRTSRPCRHNNDKNFLVWVNEEDHTRVISMEKGGNMQDVFTRFCTGLKEVESQISEDGHEFMWNKHLGYVLTCPSNLGTGLRAGVHIKIPRLGTVSHARTARDFTVSTSLAPHFRRHADETASPEERNRRSGHRRRGGSVRRIQRGQAGKIGGT